MNKAWEAASQEMYAATQEAQAGGEAGDAGAPTEDAVDDNVSDVEFEEVKDDEK